MPQSKEVKKEQARLRMQKMRNKGADNVTLGVTQYPAIIHALTDPDKRKNVTQSPESVTESPDDVTLDVTQYPAILKALVDPLKREKLEKVYQSLNNFKVADKVYYGCRDPVPFDVVGELLEATRN